jgi:FG-GAP repeat protein
MNPRGAAVTVNVMRCAVTAVLLVIVAALSPLAAAATVAVPERASLVLVGEDRSDQAGSSVARAGDVSGDGHGDLIVGAPKADSRGRRDAGSAYVVFGPFPRGRLPLGKLGDRGFRIDGAAALANAAFVNWVTDGTGALVAGAGDVNGDGVGDLLIGAAGADIGRTVARGVVFVLHGRRDPVDVFIRRSRA